MDDKLIKLITEQYRDKFANQKFIPGESSVPVSGKVFDEREMLSMVEAVLDGWWTEGRFAELFERRLSRWLGTRYVAIVNSGSSANLVALSSLTSVKLGERRLKAGDEVITAAAGFPTTINPIIQQGMLPVFVDIELGNYNASVDSVAAAIGPKTRAVILAHTLGNPFEVDKMKELCKKNNLWLIEDNCDALGSMYGGQKTGNFGNIATSSFYPAHHITMGEGGAVSTNDPFLDKIAKSIRDWGRDCWCKTGKDNTCGQRFCWKLGDLPEGYDHKYIYSELGYNLKVTDVQAALGLAQLDKLDGFVQKRKDNFKYLSEHLKQFEEYFILPRCLPAADPSWFGFLLTVREDASFSRSDIIQFLQSKKIATRLLFAGNITKQPYFIERKLPFRCAQDLKNTNLVMNNTFWIGCYPGITEEMLSYTVECFGEFFKTL